MGKRKQKNEIEIPQGVFCSRCYFWVRMFKFGAYCTLWSKQLKALSEIANSTESFKTNECFVRGKYMVKVDEHGKPTNLEELLSKEESILSKINELEYELHDLGVELYKLRGEIQKEEDGSTQEKR